MKKYISLCLLCYILVLSFVSSSEASEKNDRFIVLFQNGSEQDVGDDPDIRVIKEFTHLSGFVVSGNDKAISKLRINKNVKMIERDGAVSIDSQSSDWGIQATHAEIAWNNNYTGKNIKVGIIDTGIHINHQDLYVEGGQSFVDYTTSFSDDNGHGTHIAGVIGSKNNTVGTVGIAPEASIYALKALDQQGQGSIADVIEAVDWSISAGMDIINLSLSSFTDSVAIVVPLNNNLVTVQGIPGQPTPRLISTVQIDKDTVWVIEADSDLLKVITRDTDGYHMKQIRMSIQNQ
jgi:minor extracellular protease Epr